MLAFIDRLTHRIRGHHLVVAGHRHNRRGFWEDEHVSYRCQCGARWNA